MPQNSPAYNLQNPTTHAPAFPDVAGDLKSQLQGQGLSSALNLTAATVIKASAGRIVRISVISGGSTGGSFVLNDAATVGGAVASNQLYVLAQGAAAGTIVTLDLPFTNGLVLSAVPTGGSPQLAISYT